MTRSIERPMIASLDADTLVVDVDGARPALRIPLPWLRDHCGCSCCRHPQTRQRLVESFSLGPDLHASELAVVDGGEALAVTWSDGHHSRFSRASFGEMLGGPSVRPRGWLAEQAQPALEPRSHDAIMEDDAALLDWLEVIERHGFGLVEGVPASPEATERLCRRIGYIRHSIFGGLWEFTSDLAYGDTAYTNEALDLHTDGTYCHDAPGLQTLHCLELSSQGPETRLVDGFAAAERLRRADPDAFERLCRVEVTGQYVEPGQHLRARRPVLRVDAHGRLVQVSFNNADRAPMLLPEQETRDFHAALGAFFERLHEPAAVLRFVLEPGTVLCFDNWRVLHGRAAYTGRRRMCGCYHNREDFESRLRVLRERLDQTPGSTPRST